MVTEGLNINQHFTKTLNGVTSDGQKISQIMEELSK